MTMRMRICAFLSGTFGLALLASVPTESAAKPPWAAAGGNTNNISIGITIVGGCLSGASGGAGMGGIAPQPLPIAQGTGKGKGGDDKQHTKGKGAAQKAQHAKGKGQKDGSGGAGQQHKGKGGPGANVGAAGSQGPQRPRPAFVGPNAIVQSGMHGAGKKK